MIRPRRTGPFPGKASQGSLVEAQSSGKGRSRRTLEFVVTLAANSLKPSIVPSLSSRTRPPPTMSDSPVSWELAASHLYVIKPRLAFGYDVADSPPDQTGCKGDHGFYDPDAS